MEKSELCMGYGLGPTCIACCVCDNIYSSHLFKVSFDIYFKKQKVFESNGRNYSQNREIFYGMLGETTKRFNDDEKKDKIKKICWHFKNIDRFKAVSEDIPEPNDDVFEFIREYLQNTGFLGMLSDGRVGCLLYELTDSTGNSFKHKECLDYICKLGEIAKIYPHVHTTMQEFIDENMPFLDSFNYSRMIHILSHHESDHTDIGIDLNILTDRSKKSRIKDQLKLTLDLVTNTEQDADDSVEKAIAKTKAEKRKKALELYYSNFGKGKAVSLDFSARVFGLEPADLIDFI